MLGRMGWEWSAVGPVVLVEAVAAAVVAVVVFVDPHARS